MYKMPMRMWQHGIHTFLEILRIRLPHSLDYILTFVALSYQMMTLLYETVPAFEDTWIQCLGDLARYGGYACGNNDILDKEVWAQASRDWYRKAADRNPTLGHLYHHLGILARPDILQQLYYYSRSLHSYERFCHARETISTRVRAYFFQKGPFLYKGLAEEGHPWHTGMAVEEHFVVAHALISRLAPEGNCSPRPTPEAVVLVFLNGLDNYIGRITAKWKQQGVYIAVANISAWFDYGKNDHILRQLLLLRAALRKDPGFTVHGPRSDSQQEPKVPMEDIADKVGLLSSDENHSRATRLTNDTFAIALGRAGDENVLPHVHVMLACLVTFASVEDIAHLIDGTPWSELAAFLNVLVKKQSQAGRSVGIVSTISQSVFPTGDKQTSSNGQILPEDYIIRGLIWAEEYLPCGWFENRDEEERPLELPSTIQGRSERILRLGFRLSTFDRWISFDKKLATFAVVKASSI